MLFLPREHKIHIFEPTCNVLFIIWRLNIQQKQKAGIVTSLNDTTLTKVAYGKYATRVPDEVAYGIYDNLVPRVSHLTAKDERGETLVGSGHVSPRIWEMTIKIVKGWAA